MFQCNRARSGVVKLSTQEKNNAAYTNECLFLAPNALPLVKLLLMVVLPMMTMLGRRVNYLYLLQANDRMIIILAPFQPAHTTLPCKATDNVPAKNDC